MFLNNAVTQDLEAMIQIERTEKEHVMEQILKYLRTHRQQHRDELFQLVRFPSISTDPAHEADVAACGQFLVDHLKAIGLSQARLMPTQRHPVVYAEWLEAPGAPTILLYGHYDVQPPDPFDLWKSDPFEPEIREGEMYARGMADDKGQLFAHVKAIEAYLHEHGRLPVNIKLLFEGEEEIGSEHLHAFVEEHAQMLQADAILLSDTAMFGPKIPTICYGTRGLIHCQIDLESAARDLHSGGFGGIAENPIQVLADIISALKDQNGRITIPGYYDDVADLSEQEQRLLQALPFDEEALKQEIGAVAFTGECGFSTLERRWVRPTLDVNGIVGGFTGEGVKTIIPAKASAKITMRLVAYQDPEKIVKATKAYIQKLAPETVTMTVSAGVGGKSYLTPVEHPILPHIARALRKAYDNEPVFTRTGGTIGVLSTFSETLKVPIVMVGLSHPDENIHAPNEHMNEDAFYVGREAAAHLLDTLQAWQPE